MVIFYLQLKDVNFTTLSMKIKIKALWCERIYKEGGDGNVKSKFKRIMDSNRSINR